MNINRTSIIWEKFEHITNKKRKITFMLLCFSCRLEMSIFIFSEFFSRNKIQRKNVLHLNNFLT